MNLRGEKMDNTNIPKIVTSELMESVLSNEEALKKLFHLDEEEGFIEGDTSRISWNSKMIKLLLCDVQIHVVKGSNDIAHNNSNAKIYINASNMSNKANDSLLVDEIEKIIESVVQINRKIDNFQAKLRRLETLIRDIEYDMEVEDYGM